MQQTYNCTRLGTLYGRAWRSTHRCAVRNSCIGDHVGQSRHCCLRSIGCLRHHRGTCHTSLGSSHSVDCLGADCLQSARKRSCLCRTGSRRSGGAAAASIRRAGTARWVGCHTAYGHNGAAGWIQMISARNQRLARVDVYPVTLADALSRLPRWIICRRRAGSGLPATHPATHALEDTPSRGQIGNPSACCIRQIAGTSPVSGFAGKKLHWSEWHGTMPAAPDGE